MKSVEVLKPLRVRLSHPPLGLNHINRFKPLIIMPSSSEYHKKYYAERKGKYAESSKASRQKKREWYNGIMDTKACIKCGESDNACLDWHHTDPTQKEASVSFLIQNRSKKAILEEIDKCICLCANCHRKLHYYGA